MGSIRLENIKKVYGKDVVVPDLSMEIEDGSFTILVGPSGCGKSTTLRMITGLESPTEGKIYIDDKDVRNIAPGKRDIAMVFQNYALYPTMTVRENIELGLINKKVPKQKRDEIINEFAGIVGLTHYMDRKPSTLSGGQRQRVALARAMVKKPKVFLMDEPLSNLDAKLRAQMRVELIQLHKRLGTTFVYVTHDQTEAMSMGDQIVLMDKGHIVQYSSPKDIYNNPCNIYTAQFIGTPPMNIIANIVDDQCKIGFRPERVQIIDAPVEGQLVLSGKVITGEMMGSENIYSISTKYGTIMAKSEKEVDTDSNVLLGVSFSNLYVFNKDDKRIEITDDIKKAILLKSEGRNGA